MKITVLADATGEVIGAVVPSRHRPEQGGEHPQMIQVVAAEAEVVVTVDLPEELVDPDPDLKYLDALRRYTVRDGDLVRKHGHAASASRSENSGSL